MKKIIKRILALLILIFVIIKINNEEIDIFYRASNFIGNIGSGFLVREKSDDIYYLYKNIEKNKDENDKINWIYENFDSLSKMDIYLVGNDLDLAEFVYNVHNGISEFENYSGESVDYNRDTPFYLQWDNRWAYNKLSTSIIGYAGCGPTSMAMILNRLNPSLSLDPSILANDAENYMGENGVEWDFFNYAANKYGFNIKNISLDKDSMVQALENYPLLISVDRGYFTLSGHILVIDSYKNGKFIINDPNSIKNTERKWTFEQLKNQIANIWLIY